MEEMQNLFQNYKAEEVELNQSLVIDPVIVDPSAEFMKSNSWFKNMQ